MSRRLKRALGSLALCLGIVLPTGMVLCVGSDGHLALELAACDGCAETSAATWLEGSRDDHCADSCLDTRVGAAEFKLDRSSVTDSIAAAGLVTVFCTVLPRVVPDSEALASHAAPETTRSMSPVDVALRTTVLRC